jgi:hypothetical protein
LNRPRATPPSDWPNDGSPPPASVSMAGGRGPAGYEAIVTQT